MNLFGGDDGAVYFADVVHRLEVIGQPAHADLDNVLYIRELGGTIHPRGVIEIAWSASPSVQVGVEVDQGQRNVVRTKHGECNAVVSTKHDGERLLGQDGAYGASDAVVGLHRHGLPRFHVTYVCPMLALQNHAIAV